MVFSLLPSMICHVYAHLDDSIKFYSKKYSILSRYSFMKLLLWKIKKTFSFRLDMKFYTFQYRVNKRMEFERPLNAKNLLQFIQITLKIRQFFFTELLPCTQFTAFHQLIKFSKQNFFVRKTKLFFIALRVVSQMELLFIYRHHSLQGRMKKRKLCYKQQFFASQ